MTLPDPPWPDPISVELKGDGPFLLPFIGPEVGFDFGHDVAMMRMVTLHGQHVVLPFQKETLRAIGLALAETLKHAFDDEPQNPDEVVFMERDRP